VTIEFGGNDFNHLVASAAWQTASPAEQQVLFAQLLNQVALNYETVLTGIQMHAPGAHILLPGYFDSTPLSDPSFGLTELAIGAGDQLVQQIAPAFGATYVDFYSVINGHATELTNPNGHANQAGYAALALALDAAVPEPASLAMLCIGLAGLLGGRCRRQKSSRTPCEPSR
jgi:lysophospholipase L1-like esterase